MQGTDLGDCDHLSDPAWHDRAWPRTILVERKMRAGALVVVDARGKDAAQMTLVVERFSVFHDLFRIKAFLC
jgi:hypothetical protein